MGGGYIQCDDFCGDDKSGSAMSGVLEELPSQLSDSERETFVNELIAPLQRQLDETGEYFLIPPASSKRLLPVVDSLYDNYRQRFGDADVWDAIELDDESGLDPIEAKWGKGAGWRYYCLTDLRVALRRSIDSDSDVCVSFD
ncbi:hypothetical protein Q31b_50170 [Novipirellula aureliae]|uniref:Uncharacterized protein n=3 Tax=Pirellulales TaxID=2691354 RepID=A0A5C6DKI6_9BACT|nr:hypothetical protein RBSWK_05949 [Rhodopirellula baltica SWK14]TWU36735.1 hypothetical protein Q31b_50170 [Novipirellula aureliae]